MSKNASWAFACINYEIRMHIAQGRETNTAFKLSIGLYKKALMHYIYVYMYMFVSWSWAIQCRQKFELKNLKALSLHLRFVS